MSEREVEETFKNTTNGIWVLIHSSLPPSLTSEREPPDTLPSKSSVLNKAVNYRPAPALDGKIFRTWLIICLRWITFFFYRLGFQRSLSVPHKATTIVRSNGEREICADRYTDVQSWFVQDRRICHGEGRAGEA